MEETDDRIQQDPAPTLDLVVGADRSLAWKDGNSVRYLVADLIARRDANSRGEMTPLNLALAIDVSSSMAGEKLAFARNTALSVVDVLEPRDRLTLVTFSHKAVLLLDALAMDAGGTRRGGNRHRRPAQPWQHRFVRRLAARRRAPCDRHAGCGKGLAPAAAAVRRSGQPGHHRPGRTSSPRRRVAGPWHRHLHHRHWQRLRRGAARRHGGGRRRPAARRRTRREISEVVLGELLKGRGAVLERVRLCISVPATMRAEVVGPWAHTVLGGTIEVLVGTLLPDRLRRVVLRLHCPAGAPGEVLLLGAAAEGMLPDGTGQVEAPPADIEIRLARSGDNNAQPRDLDRSQAVVKAWHAAILRKAVGLDHSEIGAAAATSSSARCG